MPLVVPGLSTTPTTTSASSSQDSVFDVGRYAENPVPERSGSTSEELRGNAMHKPTETENKKKKDEGREEVHRDLLHDVLDWLQEFRENLVDERSPLEPWGKMSIDIGTLPVLLLNYQWSREQKWNRARARIV